MRTHLTLASIEAALRQPFRPEDVKFLPKSPTKNEQGQWRCLAFPYADKRAYEDRLNELAFEQWSTPYTPPLVAGNKLVIPVTVILCDVARTDYGEATLTSLNRNGEVREEENSATEGYSQGFRRACSQFGLGRYFYDLPKLWLPYDPKERKITLSQEDKIAWVNKLYQKAGLLPATTVSYPTVSSPPPATGKPSADAGPVAPSATPPAPVAEPANPQQLATIRKLQHHLGLSVTEGECFSSEEAKRLIAELCQHYNQRRRARASSESQQSTNKTNKGAPTTHQADPISDRDVRLIKRELHHDEARIRQVCADYQVSAIEQLTSKQALHLINRIFAARRQSSATTTAATYAQR